MPFLAAEKAAGGGTRGQRRRRGDEVRASRETGGARGSRTWDAFKIWLVDFPLVNLTSQNADTVIRNGTRCIAFTTGIVISFNPFLARP